MNYFLYLCIVRTDLQIAKKEEVEALQTLSVG